MAQTDPYCKGTLHKTQGGCAFRWTFLFIFGAFVSFSSAHHEPEASLSCSSRPLVFPCWLSAIPPPFSANLSDPPADWSRVRPYDLRVFYLSKVCGLLFFKWNMIHSILSHVIFSLNWLSLPYISNRNNIRIPERFLRFYFSSLFLKARMFNSRKILSDQSSLSVCSLLIGSIFSLSKYIYCYLGVLNW